MRKDRSSRMPAAARTAFTSAPVMSPVFEIMPRRRWRSASDLNTPGTNGKTSKRIRRSGDAESTAVPKVSPRSKKTEDTALINEFPRQTFFSLPEAHEPFFRWNHGTVPAHHASAGTLRCVKQFTLAQV